MNPLDVSFQKIQSGDQTTFVLIRHGNTATNQAGVFTGQRSDVDLSPLGEQQARATAGTLLELDFQIAAVFSSPLSRARHTASILAASLGQSVVVDERLAEFDFGAFEGRSVTEVHDEDPDIRRFWRPDQAQPLPEGESAAAVADRICDFFEDAASRHEPPATILVIGHMAAFAMGLARVLEDADNALDYAVDNCSISLLEYGDPPKLLTFNQIDHIQHLLPS